MDEKLIKKLAQPFPAAFVEWLPKGVTKDGKRALAAAFVDPRHYQHRLDQLVPGWTSAYQFIRPDGSLVKCSLTVDGITREEVGESDTGEQNTATSAVAQAFKRACAAFGLGRYLYFLPQVWSEYDGGSKRFTSTPNLPAWAKPGGSGYPIPEENDAKVPSNGGKAPASQPEPAPAYAPVVEGDGAVAEAAALPGAVVTIDPYGPWFELLDPAKVTLEDAHKIVTSEGKLYCELERQELVFRGNQLLKAKDQTHEQQVKSAAIRLLLAEHARKLGKQR